MNSEHHQPEVPSLDEDLVAYLDGELDDSASRRLEERLANDDSARVRLRSLATSWDLLDHFRVRRSTSKLHPHHSRNRCAGSANDLEAEKAAMPAQIRRRWIAGAAAAVACAMIGFAAVVVAWPDANERLLRNLPVVQNLELYEIAPHTGTIDFLKDLEKDELFIGDTARVHLREQSQHRSAARLRELPSGVLKSRHSAEKKAELRKLYVRFEELSEEDKDQLHLDRALPQTGRSAAPRRFGKLSQLAGDPLASRSR